MIQTNTTTVDTFQVLDDIFTPPPGTSTLAYIESGLTLLPLGVQVTNIPFTLTKAAQYVFDEAVIVNSVDDPPLTLGFEITSPNTDLTGFQITLTGLPDTNNYFLKWRVAVPPQ